ncbi:MAG: hypothetical protein SVR81_07085 [Chloroflexota bacterium]|nr:hypothetical protein [Chloroflexota bacterium]
MITQNDRKTRKTRLGLTLLLFAFIIFGTGCNVLLPPGPQPPTATPTTTLTPTPTIDWFPATPTPTLIPISSPTPQATLPDTREGMTELLISDDFSDPTSWTAPSAASGNVAFGNENLVLAPAQQDAYLFSLSPYNLPANFYLELTFETTLCQQDDQFGIVFWRESQGDYYRIAFSCEGQYRLELVQSGVPVVVHDWENASNAQPGAPATNRVGLWVYQGTFQLYINDAFQFEERVAQNRSGELGVFARTVSSNAMTVRASDLQIYRVEEE